jgi:hypothetical protein
MHDGGNHDRIQGPMFVFGSHAAWRVFIFSINPSSLNPV